MKPIRRSASMPRHTRMVPRLRLRSTLARHSKDAVSECFPPRKAPWRPNPSREHSATKLTTAHSSARRFKQNTSGLSRLSFTELPAQDTPLPSNNSLNADSPTLTTMCYTQTNGFDARWLRRTGSRVSSRRLSCVSGQDY